MPGVTLFSFLGLLAESEERLQQVVSCKASNDTGVWIWIKGSEDQQLAYHIPWPSDLLVFWECVQVLGARIKRLGLFDLLKMGT